MEKASALVEIKLMIGERVNSSVFYLVECLTQDQGATSLTVTAKSS